MKANDESITNLQKIEKVLRSPTTNFDYIVVSIEESKNLAEMKVEELQASLEANDDEIEAEELRDGESDWIDNASKIH